MSTEGQSYKRSESPTRLTQSRYLLYRWESRSVEWKWASWARGKAAKFQGGVRRPAGFFYCFEDRSLCWASHLGTFSPQPFFLSKAIKISVLYPGMFQPLMSLKPLPSTLSSLSPVFSQKNHLRVQPCSGVPAPGCCCVTSGRSPHLSESPFLQQMGMITELTSQSHMLLRS